MKTIFRAVFKLLALITAGVLVVALPLSLTLFNLGEVLFSEPAVERITSSVVVDSDLVPGALDFITNQRAEEISQEIETQGENNQLNLFYLIEGMEIEDWRNMREELLTDEILKQWISSSVNGFFYWLNSPQTKPEMQWNMRPLIERMKGPPGRRVVNTYYNSLPDCTDLQMEEMKTDPGDPLPKVAMVENLCKLSTFPHQEQIKVYQEILSMAVDRMPGEYDLTQRLVEEDGALNKPFAVKKNLRSYRQGLALLLLAPLALLLLIIVFGVRSLEELGLWWGIPLVGGSLIAFVTSLLVRPLWTGILSERMPETIPATSVLYHELIAGSARLIGEVFNPLRWQSFLILLLGLGLLVMGFVIRMGKSPDRGPGD